MSESRVSPPVDSDQAAKPVRTTVSLEPRVREALELWAQIEHRSVSQTAALFLEQALGVGEPR